MTFPNTEHPTHRGPAPRGTPYSFNWRRPSKIVQGDGTTDYNTQDTEIAISKLNRTRGQFGGKEKHEKQEEEKKKLQTKPGKRKRKKEKKQQEKNKEKQIIQIKSRKTKKKN